MRRYRPVRKHEYRGTRFELRVEKAVLKGKKREQASLLDGMRGRS